MAAIFLFTHIVLNGFFFQSPKVQMQEPILLKHTCKIIENGYFVFCYIDKNNITVETTFSYNINLKKKQFTVLLVGSDTISIGKENNKYLAEFSNSYDWNKKRVGSSVEKYFLIFHPDFLVWDNSQKLKFFLRICKKKSIN